MAIFVLVFLACGGGVFLFLVFQGLGDFKPGDKGNFHYGFSPKNALTLLEDDVFLDVIDVTDFVGEKEKEIAHKRGRVIGSHGSIRKDIEEHCDTMVSVYGKTIALIGRAEGMYKARRAVEMLLEGASHHIVLSFLKKVSRDSVEPMEV